MTGVGPTDQGPQTLTEAQTPPPPPASNRMARFTFANMLRSLAPLLLIVLAIVWWTSFRQSGDVQPVRPVDTASTVQLAANRAGYPVLVPTGLPDGYRPTSVRTDAGDAGDGDPVTLQIGYVTPSDQFAGYVISDDPQVDAVTGVLRDATERGTVDVGGRTWTQATRPHAGKQDRVLSSAVGGVTVVISGSASEAELEQIAGSLRPYSG